MQKKPDIQPEDFEVFLNWLASEPDQACKKYEEIRLRLVKVFVCRGCSDPEYLADETIDRVVRKIKEIKEIYIGDAPIKYIYGVARNIYLEFLRHNQKTQTALNLLRPSPALIESSESFCLNYCLEELPGEQTQLFLDYYQNDERPKIQIRRELADKLALDVNALRVKIHRLRQSLQNCIEDCLNKK
jgi:DNA-directed RNA polymerase specialized sigma24 family protein